MQKREQGFSLLELMIVIVILGMLVAVLAPKIIDRPDEARVTKAQVDMRQLGFALKLYKLDSGMYPNTEQGLKALIKKPDLPPLPRNWKEGGYLETQQSPKDPWGNEYIYRSPGDEGRSYEIISLGSDGEPGGEGIAKDLKSWELGS